MPNKFSSFSPSGRKELLEKLTKSDFMIEDIKQRVGARSLEVNKQLRDCEDGLLIHTTQNKATESTLKLKLDEISKAVKPDFIGQINELTERINNIQKDIDDKTAQIKFYEEQESKANAELVKVLEENTTELSVEKEAYDNAYRTCLTEKTRLDSEIRSLTRTISNLKAVKDACPTCGQKLPGAVKPDTSEQEKELITLNESLKQANEKLAECNTKHTAYQAQIKVKYEETINKLKSQVTGARHEKEVAQRDLTDFIYYQNKDKEQLNKLNYDKDN